MADKSKGNTKHPIPFQKVVRETDAAFLIRFEDGQEHWLPKSQCWLQIMVPEWLIQQKSLKPMAWKEGPVYGEHAQTPKSKAEQSMYDLDDDERPF